LQDVTAIPTAASDASDAYRAAARARVRLEYEVMKFLIEYRIGRGGG
jgi:hypothetical protein